MKKLSLVTPTFKRPNEVRDLVNTIAQCTVMPDELVLVDGTPAGMDDTQYVVASLGTYPFEIRYFRHQGGTAIQRNYGIEQAEGEFICFMDDDVRVEPDFFEQLLKAFEADDKQQVGGIVGYRTNTHFSSNSAQRWRWYKRLKLLTIYEPGKYDFKTGYPINNSMQPPFSGTRSVDFMTTACTMWRRKVMDEGLRFDLFFVGYGILEDAHFALRAGKKWKLLQCGDAKCIELSSPGGREKRKLLGFKTVINYYYVFATVAGPLTAGQKFRFFRYQAFELVRIGGALLRKRDRAFLNELSGRIKGLVYCATTPLSRFRADALKRAGIIIPNGGAAK